MNCLKKAGFPMIVRQDLERQFAIGLRGTFKMPDGFTPLSLMLNRNHWHKYGGPSTST
jgi:hypothetical protein